MPVRAAPAQVPRRSVRLNGGAEVSLSEMGLGLMSLSVFLGGINHPGHCTEKHAMEVIGAALERGINLVNSASFYGSGHNEKLLGKAIKKFGREKFFITDKFGQIRNEETGENLRYDLSPASIREQLAASLQRMGTDYVDCYIPARIAPDVPIEAVAGTLKELVQEGKIRYVGLSEANAETIRRANAVCPIAFLETEYSLYSLHIESSILPTCRELGVKILAYSPLGRGMLTGSVDGQFGPNDMRSHFPRFSKDNLAHNLQLVEEVKRLAEKENCSPAQLSIAWLLAKDDIFPIPGTKSVDRLQENLGATGLKLSKETMDEIAKTLAGFETKGERYPDMKIVNWQDSENRRKIEEEAQKARGQL